jgi:hypothetical protein
VKERTTEYSQTGKRVAVVYPNSVPVLNRYARQSDNPMRAGLPDGIDSYALLGGATSRLPLLPLGSFLRFSPTHQPSQPSEAQ